MILLDIDGVMLPEPCEQEERLPDGFKAFAPDAINNLSWLIRKTDAEIVLTSNHRVSYPVYKWPAIFKARGIDVSKINFINDLPFHKMMDRATEIKAWVAAQPAGTNYVAIDDDHSLATLPSAIQQRCVMTDPLIGLDRDAAKKALGILLNNADISKQ